MVITEQSSSLLTLLTGCVFTLGLAEFVRHYIRFRRNPLRNAPGPPQNSFLFGYFWLVLKAPFMQLHLQWWRTELKDSKSVPFVAYSSLFGQYSCAILDTKLIQTILTSSNGIRKEGKTPRFIKNIRFATAIAGNGLVTLEDGPDWIRHRRITQPAFARRDVVQSSVHNAVHTILVHHLLPAWTSAAEQHRPIQIHSHLTAVTLYVIGQTAFGHEFRECRTAFQDWEQAGTSELPSNATTDTIQAAFRITPLGVFLGGVLGFNSPAMLRAGKVLNRLVESMMRTVHGPTAGAPKKSLLEQLLLARSAEQGGGGEQRQTLSDTDLRDEIKTFLVAGHETTSSYCYWALYALATNESIQEKVYQDIMAQQQEQSEDFVDTATIERMTYFQAFLSEVLRYYPPVGMMFRFNTSDENWHGHCIPAMTRLIIPFYLLHRHPDHWEAPDRFWPERWLQEGTPTNKFVYLPFSTGPRSCIGNHLAQTEAQLIVANIVKVFKVSLAPSMQGVALELTNSVSLKTKPLAEICVEQR